MKYNRLFQIYNENIRDLLSNLNDSLELREDPNDGYYAVGLSEVQCMSSKEVRPFKTSIDYDWP